MNTTATDKQPIPPRRMKVNPECDIVIHADGEHDWTPACDIDPQCEPVDVPVTRTSGMAEPADGGTHLQSEQISNMTPPPDSAPEGTPVEREPQASEKLRAKLLETKTHYITKTGLSRIVSEVQKLEEAQRYWMEIVADTQRESEEQRTRAEKLQDRLDGYLAKHGAPPLTVKTHAYMLMEKERDQLKAALAAARGREAKLREALAKYGHHDNSTENECASIGSEDEGDCTCGLAKARAALAAKEAR